MAKKKAAAKDSANRAGKLSAQRALLEKELLKLIPKIDEEGLVFLIKQSHTIIYNLHVDEMNKALANVDRLKQRAPGTAEKNEAAEEGVGVETAPGGKSFVLVLGASRKVLSRVELQKLIAVVKTAGDDAAHSEQLYAWFQKHRGDVLFDGRIGSRRHPLLATLARYLRTHYKV